MKEIYIEIMIDKNLTIEGCHTYNERNLQEREDGNMSIKEKNARNRTILSLLNLEVTEKEIKEIFKLTDGEFDLLILEGSDEYTFCLENEKYHFHSVPDPKILKKISSQDLLCPVYAAWKKLGVDDVQFLETEKALVPAVLQNHERFIEFALEIGQKAELNRDNSFALKIYWMAAVAARGSDIQRRKNIFVKAVLKLSRLEFMRGISPQNTLQLQREAREMVTQSNMTADDALLFLYAGMGEHFTGDAEVGANFRTKGIKYLKEFNYAELEAEAIPIMTWHYYLMGDFQRVIGYYESYLIAIENRDDAEIISFAYLPVLFSYFFTGEYSRALALGEHIYKTAVERKDNLAANLMYSIIGRTHIYMRDLENAESILYNSYAEAVEMNYGWGLYYALFGICFYQFKKGNWSASREAMFLASQAAKKHGFIQINASPFLLDVMKMINDKNLEPVDGFDYLTKLNEYLVSDNIHLAGVANRHVAMLRKEEGKDNEEVIQYLKKSISLLEKSGNLNELALSYSELALIYNEMQDENDTAKYANRAWKLLKTSEKAEFPNQLMRFVDKEQYAVSLSTQLETNWLELRHIINEERLMSRLVTSMCRLLGAECGALATVVAGTIEIKIAQNMDRVRRRNIQQQTAEGIIAQVIRTKKIFVNHNDELNRKMNVQPGSDRIPRFCMCIPFLKNEAVIAALYVESYYSREAFSEKDFELLQDFARKMSDPLYTVLNYDLMTSEATFIEEESEFAEKLNKHRRFCSSQDEGVSFIMEQISKVAKTNIPVLITGETGVGKEVFARAVYEQSDYKKTFIKVNCGAIPESLIESELFGYEKGSFTGAGQRKKGYFELAEGGTIFLDEVGELSLIAQVKLLRILQEHELMRVGGTEAIRVDFRLVAATNKDLLKEVEAGRFRKDLYYRLNVVQLQIPPLRNRKKDIPNLADFFIEKYCSELGKRTCTLEPATLIGMLNYPWPGNVRELENTIQKAVLFAENNIVRIDFENRDGLQNMEFKELSKSADLQLQDDLAAEKNLSDDNYLSFKAEQLMTLEEMERQYIQRVLDHCGGKISGKGGAAEILGLKRTTLISKMDKLGMRNKN